MGLAMTGVLSAILCFCPLSFAKTKTQGQESPSSGSPKQALTKPMDIRRTIEFLKKFDSADQAYQTMDVLVPSLGLARWIQYFKQNNIDLNELSFNALRVDGNQVLIPKVKTPFVFSNDQKISYKGVDFKVVKEETPEQTINRMRQAWGSNSELGFNSPVRTSLYSLLFNRAFAVDSQSDEKSLFRRPFRFLLLMVPFLNRLSFLQRLAYGQSLDDLKAKNPKLICDNFNNYKFLLDKDRDFISLDDLTVFYDDDVAEGAVKGALNSVCQRGPEQVTKWNELFPVVLDKISSGEVPIRKVELRDPSFKKALPSTK